MNHGAFLVDFLRVQRQVVRPVVEDEQAGVYKPLAHGHVRDVVHGFVDGGVRIEVGAEFHSVLFQILAEQVAGEVGGAVEAHVFEEMGQTALVVFFEDGAHFLGNVEVGQILRLSVVPDIVSQSVVQLADAHVRVGRDRRHLLCECRSRASHQEDGGECFSEKALHINLV